MLLMPVVSELLTCSLILDELMDRLAHPIDEKTKQTGEETSGVPSTNGKQSDGKL